MTEETDGRSRREPDDDRRDADEEQLEDVDHTHPHTGETSVEATDVGISSLMDTWVVLNNLRHGRIHQRYLYILKARGLGHSRETCALEITDGGVRLQPMEDADG